LTFEVILRCSLVCWSGGTAFFAAYSGHVLKALA